MSAFGRALVRGYGYSPFSPEAIQRLGAMQGRQNLFNTGLRAVLGVGEGPDYRQADQQRMQREVEQRAEERRRVLERLMATQKEAEARAFQASQQAATLEGQSERARLGREQALALHGKGEKAQDERARLQREQAARFHEPRETSYSNLIAKNEYEAQQRETELRRYQDEGFGQDEDLEAQVKYAPSKRTFSEATTGTRLDIAKRGATRADTRLGVTQAQLAISQAREADRETPAEKAS